jgi:hypothetical protein
MSINSRELILLTDYRGAFWSSIRNKWGLCSLDVDILQQAFDKHGYRLRVMPFSEVNLRTHNFRGQPVLYQSSEDKSSSYKDYLEDVLLGIQLQGGQLVPPFHCFRAHHNKVFMEILRDLSGDVLMLRPRARTWGTLEDFKASEATYPAVLKRAWGAGSGGVGLAHNREEGVSIAARFSRSAGILDAAKEHVKRWWRRKKGYVPYSMHRQTFLIQEFLPGLTGDFKVLVYSDRYYVVSRKNRVGDFRASGSGLLSWPEAPPTGLLDFARHVFAHFRVPMISLDIAMVDEVPVLIEFQCICFGPVSCELSKWFFRHEQGQWVSVQAKSVPEEEFARSVCCYLQEQGC